MRYNFVQLTDEIIVSLAEIGVIKKDSNNYIDVTLKRSDRTISIDFRTSAKRDAAFLWLGRAVNATQL